jgi:hypothetical protein
MEVVMVVLVRVGGVCLLLNGIAVGAWGAAAMPASNAVGAFVVGVLCVIAGAFALLTSIRGRSGVPSTSFSTGGSFGAGAGSAGSDCGSSGGGSGGSSC